MTARPPGRQLSLLAGDASSEDGEESDRARFGPPKVPATPIATSGRTEYTADCPRCHGVHRHTRPGPRQGPCGARYTIPDEPD